MEKIACALWKPAGTPEAEYGKQLREVAPALAEHGATSLRVSVVDEHVAAGTGIRVGGLDPAKDAFVTFWLHEAGALRGPLLETLAANASRVAAWLVVESTPLLPPTASSPGERSPGFNLVTGIEPRDGLSYAAFIEHWHGVHRAVAIETQSSTAYVRNEIVRALSPDVPTWAAIVEEHFPIAALDDQAVFYDAEGDPERLERNRGRMLESCLAFLDMKRVDSHPMSEYVFGNARGGA